MTDTDITGPAATGLVATFGELRLTLLTGAVISLLTVPFADPSIRYANLGVLADVIVPVITVILVFVLLLDSLMSRVFMSQHEGAGKRRFRIIIRTNLIMVALLLLAWIPYLIKALT